MINWTLQTIPIKQLKPNPKNPRQINKDQAGHLQELIEKFGLIDKPIVNMDYVIIGGHQRIKILKKMRVKDVECWVPDRQLSDEEVDRLMIGVNLNQGTFDYDILSSHFEPIDLLSWGFTEKQLFDTCVQPEEETAAEENERTNKKKHTCPSCGYEF